MHGGSAARLRRCLPPRPSGPGRARSERGTRAHRTDRAGGRARSGNPPRPPRTPEDLREPAERLALFQPLAELAPELERLLGRLDRLVDVVAEVAGVGALLEQMRPLARLQPIAELERPGIVGGRLVMRTE